MKKERDNCKNLLNGSLVPKESRCSWCGKTPRKNDIFGTRKKDWDATLNICPMCWPAEPEG